MPKKRKWEINGLSDNQALKAAAGLVLIQRLDSLNSAIKTYFSSESPENLHEVRIALRRLRYNMEIFFSCFDKKKFLLLYQIVEHLQDLTGNKRDLDVLANNLSKLMNLEKNGLDQSLINKLEGSNKELNDALVLELLKFMHCKELKDFMKMLNYERKTR